MRFRSRSGSTFLAGDGMEGGRDQFIANLFLLQCPRILRHGPNVERERCVAIHDLLEENRFEPAGGFGGPYNLHLELAGERLVFDIRDATDHPLTRVVLPISPLRAVVKDYFIICDSYFKASGTVPPAHLEAIDAGRRGVHDEGAEILRASLSGKICIDKDTARRLFTLICVLHIR